MILFLIRHGQSKGNVVGEKKSLIKGRSDNSNLTKKGKSQIEKIAKTFFQKKISLNKIFISPLKRTKQSAGIFKRFYPKTPVISDNDLLDIDFGKLDGKTWQTVQKKYSSWLIQFQKDRINTPFPGGESRKDLERRIKKFIKKNLTNEKLNYLIISHEEVIRCFLNLFSNSDYFYQRQNLKKIDNAKVQSIFKNKNLKLIYQINDKKPFILKEKDFFGIKNFFKKEKINHLFLQKNPSFSDNIVFTVISNNQPKKILKMIPIYKEESLKKEIYLCSIFKKINLPVPSCLKIKKSENYFFHLRNFIDQPIGKTFIDKPIYQSKLANFMGKILNKIHKKTKFLANDKKFKKLTNFYGQKKWLSDFIHPWLKNDLNTLNKINFPKSKIALIKKAFDYYLKKIQIIPEGLIYYDFHPDNFAVNFLNNQFILTGLWDFENIFWGDQRFDLAYTIKLSFFNNKKAINFFLKGYFNSEIKLVDLKIIFFYLLMITTGSITYKKERGLNYQEEIKNLNYFLNYYYEDIY